MKKLLLLVISLCVFILSSCGYKDIDRRYFVVSIGVDKGQENMYDISLKLAVPSGEVKTGSNESKIMTESAQTISEAVRIIKSKVDKELDFSHSKMIVLGEQLVKEDISNIFDWFIRRRDIQLIAWTAVGSPSALKILEAKPAGERLPSNSLFLSFGNVGTETPYISSVYLFEFNKKHNERGIDPFLPIIKAEEQDYSINHMSIFSNMKETLRIDDEQTKYFNMITNNSSKTEIKVEKEKEVPYFVFATDEVRASYQINTEENSPSTIVYEIDLSGIVEESFDVLDDEKTNEYEKIIENKVEQQIQNLLVLLKKESVDPIGFGLRYRASHTGKESTKLDDWEKIYQTIEFKVNAHVKMKNVGIIQDQDGYPE